MIIKRKKHISEVQLGEPARLDVENLTASYNGKNAVEDLTFRAPHGAHIAVVGPNGAGKSTLFKALVGLLPIKKGRILIHGLPLGLHQECVAYIPQREEVDWRFPVTVEDVVMMGRFGHMGRFKRPSVNDRQIVARSLEQLGMGGLAKNPVGDLSGGQQQRVFLARALAQEPHILLMDEPFTGVDVSTQETMLDLLEELREQQVTILISTHDLNLATDRFDQVLLLNRRLIAYAPPQEAFTTYSLKQAFGGKVLVLPGGAVVVDDCCPPEEPAIDVHQQEA